MTFDRALAVASVLAFAMTVASPSYAQDKAQEKPPEKTKLNKAEMAQYQSVHALVDAVMAGKQPPPADFPLKFQNHFMKSARSVFVPYVLEIGSGKLDSFPVAMYVRAVRRSAAGAATPAEGSKAPAQTEKKAAEYPFENIYFLADAKSLVSTGPETVAVTRALDLAPGDYDVYIALAETPPKNAKDGSGKKALLMQPLTVPDLSTGLTTSTVILGKSGEDAPQQLTAQQQLEQPFTLGGYKITPTFSPAFPKTGEFLFLFMIYNEGVASTGKPDLTVDYSVFRAAEAKPFSKLATGVFNGTTLPAEFNLSAGHQVMVAQGFPLASFAPGDYKLEIKITDKTNSQSVVRDVPFTVTP
jgi:hypothetical protein